MKPTAKSSHDRDLAAIELKGSCRMQDETENQTSQMGNTIRLLGSLLGETIVAQSGRAVFELEERIRALAKAWRKGDPSAREQLGDILSELVDDLPKAANIVNAFTVYFQLVNLVEEHERVRILQERAEQAFRSDEPMDESIVQAVSTLKEQGVDAGQMQAIIQRLSIMPVFTAHPTESRRRTIRQILKQCSRTLSQLQSEGTPPYERPSLVDNMRSYLTVLWQSDVTRMRRPTVMDEVRNSGLYFFEETLFDAIPLIYEELEEALRQVYPDATFRISPLLQYGSWIGGDRDGNPLVTNEVTASALRAHKDCVLQRYQDDVFSLYEFLSVSENHAGFSREFLGQLQQDIADMEVDADDVIHRFDTEPYRQKLILMYRKIAATRQQIDHPEDHREADQCYGSADELLQDLTTIRDSLMQHQGADLTRGLLSRLIRRIEVFGFHLATIDVRQHADRHRQAISEIFESYQLVDGYRDLSEDDKVALLSQEIESQRPLTAKLRFSDATNETVSAFRLIRQAQHEIAPESMQTYIISMTRNVSHLLEILLLARDANLFGKIDIVPLFETVEDLKNAPRTMAALFDHPSYRRHLQQRGDRQQIMIGYSDSNKDGGYLRANWMLFTAQRALAATCRQVGIELTLFHGRGGSLGRGGGPANRAILAQPHESVDGRIRITEQGEVVSSRYSHPEIARRHLQQLLHAVICSTGKQREIAELPRWSEIMDEVSEVALQQYRRLVQHPQFIEYFLSATPIQLVENLNIGSRPSRRTASQSIDDLRAIPWVFSWTQSRANISSWYGTGTALEVWCQDDPERLKELRQMYRQWPFFNTLLKNIHVGLGRGDMNIARLYAQLAPEHAREIFDWIDREYQLTCRHVLAVTQQDEILDTEPWLQRSIQRRNPYVDPLNYVQVAMLEKLRDGSDREPADRDEQIRILVNSVNGVAAGLQSVG